MRRKKTEPMQWGDERAAKMTAAIYARKSTATEGRSKSRDEQREICQQDAERFGFGKVVEYVEEEGQHGEWWWKDEHKRNPGPHRPILTELVKAIENEEIQALLVYKQDRLVRDSGVADALNKLCRKHEVRFISRGRDTEIDTARGLYQVAVDSAAARQWRDQISEDICRDHDYKFKLLMFTRNPSCFGFRSRGRESQAVQPIYAEQRTVVRIFQMFLGIGQSALGPYQIARVLEKEGVVVSTGSKGHKVKNPKKVHGGSIRQILKNPMYMGYWQHNGERAFFPRLLVEPEGENGEAASVIPESWFYAAEAKLASRPKAGRKAAGDKRLLSGLVNCAACGRQMHVNVKYLKNGDKTLRWFCSHRTGTFADCVGENYATLVIDELDEWAIKHLAPYLQSEVANIRHESEGSDPQVLIHTLEGQLNQIRNSEVKALKKALGVLDDEQIASLAREFRADRQELESKILELRKTFAEGTNLYRAPDDLSSMELPILKAALCRFIKWIAVSDSGVTVLTEMGTYVGAEFVERDMTLYGTAENRRTLRKPDLKSICECPIWISDPSAFVAGRRYALGAAARRLSDHELLPGYSQSEKEPDAA